MEEKRVYLDHNATTPLHPEVMDAMLPFFQDFYGNPSSIHQFGRKVRVQVDDARESVAKIINAQPSEIVFTSGGSESDNLALKGIALGNKDSVVKPCHIITSTTEHYAVLQTCQYLQKFGVDITFIPVDEQGVISPKAVHDAIRSDTALISIHHSNNETGVIQPIQKIGEIARKKGVLFHVDAVQSIGKTPVDVLSLHVDMMSLSAHKLNGPKGTGALFIKKDVQGLHPLINGGGQEKMRRAGTENVPGIIGFAKACALAHESNPANTKRYKALRDRLELEITNKIPGITINGSLKNRLPNTSNIRFQGVEGDSLLVSLDLAGIAVSSGSACSSGRVALSHVLRAMGLSKDAISGSLRFSFGYNNNFEDIDYIMEYLALAVERIRKISSISHVKSKKMDTPH